MTSTQVYVTQRAPKEEDGFDVDAELGDMKEGTLCVQDKRLKCVIDNQKLAEHVRKLYEFTCSVAECWRSGQQEPFVQEQMLRDHLLYDHQLRYCKVCLKDRRVFLSEQHVYTDKEYDQHLQGRCSLDSSSFQGHPPCKFCGGERHYDGEYLLKHMQHSHFSCDVCNRGEFTFAYYKNRDKLLEHFQRSHKLCDHSDCAHMDPMLRVFHGDLELQAHRQRVHNIGSRSGVSLDALGFRFSSAADAPVSPSTQQPVSTAPSSGANTHALKITFDHVSRIEEVDTMPNVTAASGKGGRNSKGGKSNAAHGTAGRSDIEENKKQGVPSAWKDPQLELRPIVVSVLRLVHSPIQQAATSRVAKPSWGSAPGAPSLDHTSSGAASSGRVAPEVSYREKMASGFDERLDRYFGNPTARIHFKHSCADFIAGKLLAAEFLTQLENNYFSKRSHELEDFFPYLVATMPDTRKAEALKTVRHMKSAPELQRQQRTQHEDESKKHAGASQVPLTEMEERLLRSRQDVARIKTESKKKQTAWASQVPAAAVAAASPTTTSPTAQQMDYPTLGSSSWGGRTTSQTTVVPPTAHVNPSDFPTLPTASKKAHHQTAKPLVKNNAWFKK